MVAGNVIGNTGDLVDELPIITKFKELFHDKVVSEIVWSGENGPDVQSDPNVAAAFGAPLELTEPKVLNLGTRSNVEFIAVAGGGGGGAGRDNGGPHAGPNGEVSGKNGTNTKFEFRAGSADGTLISSYDLVGGDGGISCNISWSRKPRQIHLQNALDIVSSDTNYNIIGEGGSTAERRRGTDATGFGAGGGGGGGDQPSPAIKLPFITIGFDESGNGGSRGVGGEFKEKKEDFSAYAGQNIYLVITQVGAGGVGADGENDGGNGAPGVVIIKEAKPTLIPESGPVFDEQGLIQSLRGDDHLGLGYKIDGNKIFDVFLNEANKYTAIRKLQVITARDDGSIYNETQVAYLGSQFITNIDITTSALVADENNLDPSELNEDENIIQYFNNLYYGWTLIRDDPIINGVLGLGSDPLPTFDPNTGLFSTSPTSVKLYTTSQSWRPTTLQNVGLVAVGAGGSGGLGSQSYGGGGGGVAIRILQVTPGEIYNFNIGFGGAAVNTGSNGVNGGNTSISGGALSSTVFGGGGQRGEATGDAPTNGGTASGGDYNIDGGNAAGAASGEQTSGGPAGGPDASISEVNVVPSKFTSSSDLTKSNGTAICGSGKGTSSSGGNFGGGGGAAASGYTGAGSQGVVAVFFF